MDAKTSPCGSEDATPGSRACVPVLVRPGRVGRAGLPGAFWCASPFPLVALSFCFARPPPGWGCPYFLFLGCLPPPLFFSLRCVSFPLRPPCLFLSLVLGPGCPGPWRLFFFPPPPPAWVFFFSLRPRCLWLSLVSGPGCPGPWRCMLFVLLASRSWALCALSPLLLFPLGRWVLPGGCCPRPPPSCLAVFVASALRPVPFLLFFFLSFFFLCDLRPRCLWLSLVSGPGCPGPWRCVLFVLFASRVSALCALAPLLCFPPRPWLLPGGCCPAPPPPRAVFRSFRRCRSFLHCFFFRCAPPLSLAFFGFGPRVPSALALCAVCFAGLLLLGSPCALASLCFPSGRWLLPGGCCPPLAVFVAAVRCSVYFFFFARRLFSPPAPPPPPGACVVPCAVCCCRAALPFRVACRAVVPRLVVLWAAARCSVFVGVFVCVLCCAIGCCCVLCPVSGRAVRLGCSRCGLLPGFRLRCRVPCCAVCPWVRCCALLLRVAPPGVVLWCAVLFCCACLVSLLVVPCPLALPVALGPCALRRRVLRCSLALCALCCVCFVVACWCEPKHPHPHRTPQPGVAGYKGSTHTSTHTPHHPSQEWRGAAETRAQTHTPRPHTQARSGGAQPKPEPKHPHPHHTPQPGVAGYKRSAHTSTHTPQHPSQEWRGTAETRTQTHTPTPHTPARSGGAQRKPEPKHTHPHRTPQPKVAGTRGARTQTRTPRHPSQEWRGAAGTQAQTHTPTPHTPARSGGVQGGHAHQHTHTPHHPSQEWRGAAQTGAQTRTPTPHSPARSGGVQARREHKHTQTPTAQPGVAGCS